MGAGGRMRRAGGASALRRKRQSPAAVLSAGRDANMASLSEMNAQDKENVNENDNNGKGECETEYSPDLKGNVSGQEIIIKVSPTTIYSIEDNKFSEDPLNYDTETDDVDQMVPKRDTVKKRYSVDYKRSRMDFKRFSVDCSRQTATLEELANLERELARTNVDARSTSRRKSAGILKSTTSSNDVGEQRSTCGQELCSDDDDVFEKTVEVAAEHERPREPPATPVGRDELALRRHRFFSDLVCAARAAVEHRVRFDPLGPIVADEIVFIDSHRFSALLLRMIMLYHGVNSKLAPKRTCGGEGEQLAAISNPAAEFEALIERLERVTTRLERLPALQAQALSSPRSPETAEAYSPTEPVQDTGLLLATDDMSVNGYQDLLQGPLRAYLELSQQIGGDVATHANLVNEAFQAQLRYIQLASSRSKPSQAEEMQLLAPTSDKISAIQQFREKNRVSSFFNHLSAISESIPALGWVAVAPTPAPYVKEMNDAGQFYTNRVLKEWKEKDKRHVEWCRAWVQLLTDLQAYVKQHHTTGLVWSGTGAGAPPPPPPGGLPPPPPVLPEADFANMSVDDRSALFAEINQGEGITSHLRKVTSDMQTHKNPTLRQGPAPFKAAHAAPPAPPAKPLPQPGAGKLDKPPVFVRDGKKWLIEYQKGNSGLVVENADMNNVVYMFRCRDSSLTVRGKINGVVLDSCTKCAVVFDNLVASVEFVNCQSVQMQVGGAPLSFFSA
ncbi:unnamed protein product, partial [Iphiclides podalirius]